jgi:Fe-S oxidoreductase
MLPLLEKAVFALVILGTAVAFLSPLVRRFRIVRAGRPDMRTDEIWKRIGQALGKVLFQRCTLKNERLFTGLMHVFIFYGALTFDTMTVNHTLEGFFDNFYLFGKGGPGLLFSMAVDVFAVLVLVGVFFFAVRRFVVRPKAYATTPLDSAAIYSAIVLVTVSYLYFEMSAVALHPDFTRLSFLGQFLAGKFMGGLGPAALHVHYRVSWWLHILLVFGFIAYVPHSKYLHMFTGPLNLLFRRHRPSGELLTIDLESSETFGIARTADFSWKDRLDAFACMECGRCQDACPAFASEKPLSPKTILFNLEKRLLEKDAKSASGETGDPAPLVPATFTPGEVWTCTTCGACTHVCPVEIEHIPKIVGLRRSEVLMESRFPQELGAFFRNVETNSNPWGIGFAKRGDWAEGLSLPLLKDKPGANFLFWVGCMGSFDEAGGKAARAMAAIMTKAGLDFAILGTEEKCCGDSARRLGNEYLFQTLAAENLETFRKYGVRRLVTICPHGYNTFKNEYPKIVGLAAAAGDEEKARLAAIEVISHVQLIRGLLKDGRIKLRNEAPEAGAYTFHDPCYLGRHNGILDPPREILEEALGRGPRELSNNREHSFCCGAGGGLMWTEESLGRRINHLRADEVIASGARLAAAACPFCLTMLRDGLKDKNSGDIQVMDIAQIVAEKMI